MGVWTTVDLLDAMNHGYELLEVFELWDWGYAPPNSNLFANFVNSIIKMKVESGGCEVGKEEELAQEWFESEGIEIDTEKLKQGKNASLYFTTKITANSLW